VENYLAARRGEAGLNLYGGERNGTRRKKTESLLWWLDIREEGEGVAIGRGLGESEKKLLLSRGAGYHDKKNTKGGELREEGKGGG